MIPRSSIWWVLPCLVGCSASDAENDANAGTDPTAGSPAASVAPANPGDPDSVAELIDETGEPESAAPSECARDSYEAQRSQVNIYLMLDISGSMDAAVGADSEATQWDAVRTAVSGFIESDDSAGLELALNYYPSLGTRTDCDDLNRCEANVPCITRICDLSYLAFGEAWPCSIDQECGLRLTLDGQLFVESCAQPGRCDNSPFQMCFVDVECGDGAVCGPADGGLCPGEMSCEAANYEEPSVPLTALPDATSTLVESLLAHEPDMFGRTPTQVALAGAYARVAEWQTESPSERSVLVLATDGAPLGCNGFIPGADDEALSIAQTLDVIEDANSNGIETYVIGVVPDLSGLTPDDQATLQPRIDGLVSQLAQMAERGGSVGSFNVTANDTTTDEFLDALTMIRGEVLPCDYEIPAPESGSVSFTQLNVEVSSEDGTEVVPKVGSNADCASEEGWYYDVDATTETPTRVVLCPATCSSVKASTTESVDIVLGCTTIEEAR